MKLDSFLHRLAQAPAVTMIGLLLIAITAVGLLGARHIVRSVSRAVYFDIALLAITLLWWLGNHRLEGRVLLSFTSNHGFALGDLLGVPALFLAAGLFLAAWERRPASRPRLANGAP